MPAGGVPLLLAECLAMLSSPQIEEREDEHPDEVDEVPVQAGDLDRLVSALAVVEAGRAQAPALGDDTR